MKKHVQVKIDYLMHTAKLFTDTYNEQISLATTMAIQCRSEAYKSSSSLESSRIDFWEDVMDELKLIMEDVQ